MIGVGFLRCFFIIGVMSWYTTSVWKTIDQYFRDQFRDYLQKEFENNKAIRKDLMLEAERLAAQKAIINKIGKLGFSKGMEDGDIRSDAMWGQERFGHTATEVTSRSLENEYKYSKGQDEMSITLRSEDNGDSGGTSTPGESGERVIDDDSNNAGVWTDEFSESEGKYELASEEQRVDEIFKTRYETSEGECRLDGCEKDDEGKEERQTWQNFLEEDDVCRLEDLGKDDSCGDP